jgi:hypothetical protein
MEASYTMHPGHHCSEPFTRGAPGNLKAWHGARAARGARPWARAGGRT